MKFTVKSTKSKEETTYKSLYIKKSLVAKIDKIAKEHDTSWNNVVISMIESCIGEEKTY